MHSYSRAPPYAVESTTGEVYDRSKLQLFDNKIRYRNGWGKHYTKPLLNALALIIGGEQGRIVAYVLSNITIDFSLEVTQTEIVNNLKTSMSSVEAAFRKMRAANLIKRDHKVFKVNPFMWIPDRTPYEIIAKAQQEWEQI